MAGFEDCIGYVLKNEGGYSNNPNDSGGATNWGVTEAVLAAWRGHEVNADDVKQMPLSEALSIYKAHYWIPMRLDGVNSEGIAACLMDMAVNKGCGHAARTWQECLVQCGQHVAIDGSPGPATVAATNAVDENHFIDLFTALDIQEYEALAAARPKDRVFLKGWLARAKRMLALERK